MSGKFDIEDLLMRFRTRTDPRVKRAVMARYAERYGRAHRHAGAIHFWRRPVPLYLAGALVILAAALSYIGGRELYRPKRDLARMSNAVQDSLAAEALEQSWNFAPRDVL